MSSSKVLFKLETLKAKALESLDNRIAAKELELASYEDEAAFAQRLVDWRARQEAKISDLFRRLSDSDGLDNYSLSKFKLDDIPTIDSFGRRDAQRDLRALRTIRSRVVAKADSLVADEDGNISLTRVQLAEFFDL